MVTAPQLYFHIKNIFENNRIENPQFEAMCVVEHIFRKKLGILLLEKPFAAEEQIKFADNIAYRRISGEPLQYLLGEWEFFGLPFYVGRGVLIPRQDTETLVETVIESSRNFIKPKIIDLCSGSGCIACSVSAYVKNAEVYALEKSERAIGYLNKNIELNKSKITVIQADVLKPEAALVYGNFDIIACNPPYLTANDMNFLQKEVTYEPAEALFGGLDGLDFYRKITELWRNFLNDGGILAYEIGMGQENDVSDIMKKNGFTNILFIKDLSGVIRVVKGEKAI